MAVVRAQAAAAQTTMQYIRAVGFDDEGKAINVVFTYNITNSTTGNRQENSIAVPFLTIVPIPFLQVTLFVCCTSWRHCPLSVATLPD
jgi:hypothetical protein